MDRKKASEKLDEVVGRAIRDEEYRKNLASDPQGTLTQAGLSEEDLRAVAGGLSGVQTNLSTVNFYQNLSSVFTNVGGLGNITKVAWSSDLACNERG